MGDQEIVNKIVNRYHGVYASTEAQGHLKDGIQKMTSLIKYALVRYLETGNHEEINILGFTIEKLVERGQNEVAAYFSLDYLIRSPEQAIASLSKGNESVSFS